jgi:hypothetical protein
VLLHDGHSAFLIGGGLGGCRSSLRSHSRCRARSVAPALHRYVRRRHAFASPTRILPPAERLTPPAPGGVARDGRTGSRRPL